MMHAFTDSPEQARVINAPNDDDILVVAGAGSGKTYTTVSYTHLTLPTILRV